MTLFDKAKLFYKENQKLAIGIAVAAALAFGVFAYFGEAEAQEPAGYRAATVSFCMSAEVVRVVWGSASEAEGDSHFRAGGCFFSGGYPIEVYIVSVGEPFQSPFGGELFVTEMFIPGYSEDQGNAYWVVDREIADKAKGSLRGV